MAKISLNNVRHSYLASSGRASAGSTSIAHRPTWALEKIDTVWEDGGAYALLGPSGCGKTTLLNIISGLLRPTEGQVMFDDEDVTDKPTAERHIAQVFQFPVVYDTMTVFDNLAFPLKNRGVPRDQIVTRVRKIAAMLDLEQSLDQRAAGLSADGKQKISLGRGLVRSDVNVIMFDEPLTVIDPHLKWLLRSKLKELHNQVGATMIYVTHDQTEALTFADKVVVMLEGTVVQIGTPVELFEKPNHTFVGHFIGSPGMNVLPCSYADNQIRLGNHTIVSTSLSAASASNNGAGLTGQSKLEIGIRPEFVTFGDVGIPVDIVNRHDLGRFQIVETRHDEHVIKLVLDERALIPAENPKIVFDPHNTHLYADGWIVN